MGTDMPSERRAVFLDRDGVINRLVLNPATGEYEAPLTPADLEFLPGVLDGLRALQTAGFLLFLVSNQPNFAKGKSTLADLNAIHQKLVVGLAEANLAFAEFYYCFHHPRGVGNRYSRVCNCRKPSPYFLFQAKAAFDVDLGRSWMIGDRHTDIECGRQAGTRTILIADDASQATHATQPDYTANGLAAAASLILRLG